jgi:hypothetical protein
MKAVSKALAVVAACVWALLFAFNLMVVLDMASLRPPTVGDVAFVVVPLAALLAVLWVGFKARVTENTAVVVELLLLVLGVFCGLVVMAASGG